MKSPDGLLGGPDDVVMDCTMGPSTTESKRASIRSNISGNVFRPAMITAIGEPPMMSPLRVQQGNHGKRQSDAEHDLADDERVSRGGVQGRRR